jgi:antitoxin component of MazEF toxin-antitoxin module
MKKEIKQYGNSAVIVFDKEMMKAYNLKVGDILNFRISVVGRKRKHDKVNSVIPTLWVNGKNPNQFEEIKKAIQKRK